jgi:hypothetical protein
MKFAQKINNINTEKRGMQICIDSIKESLEKNKRVRELNLRIKQCR